MGFWGPLNGFEASLGALKDGSCVFVEYPVVHDGVTRVTGRLLGVPLVLAGNTEWVPGVRWGCYGHLRGLLGLCWGSKIP